MNAHGHGSLTLRLLQSRAQIEVPVPFEHRQHVRMNRRLSVLAAEKSEGETDQPVLILTTIFSRIKGPDQNIARRLEGDGKRQGQGIVVRHSPDFFLYRLQLAEVVDALEIADANLLRANAGHHG